jgi:tetratricopeptide (TPR) repeat protein
VVEFLIERFGADALQKILVDLGEGADINEALIRHTAPLGKLDADFAEFARERAEALAPAATWGEPNAEIVGNAVALGKWVATHANNVPGLKLLAQQQLKEKKFSEATATAERVRKLLPSDTGPGSVYLLLAAAQRGLGNDDAEREALEALAKQDADASEAHLRLMELAEAKGDWEGVARNAQRMLAVNPLVAAPHHYLAQAAEKLGKRDEAIRACRALLLFDTSDLAATHFRLALLLKENGETSAAKRQTLMALEEAPRYRAALELLLELSDVEDAGGSPAARPQAPAEEPGARRGNSK